LDFIPIGEERYDLLVDKEFLHSYLGQMLLSVINSKNFKEQVEKLGGYSTRDTGQIIWERK